MNTYELLYLVPATHSEDALKGIKNKVQALLDKEKAETVHHALWSQRRLAYKIKQIENAFYMLAYFKAEPSAAASVKKGMDLIQDIIRCMIVTPDNLDVQIKRFVQGIKPEEKQKETNLKVAPKPGLPVGEVKMPVSVGMPVGDAVDEKSPLESGGKAKIAHGEVKKEKEEKSPKKLVDLDKKLEDILGGEIEI